MRFLQKVKCWEYRRLPLVTHVTPLSCPYEANLLGCKDKQVSWIAQLCNNSIKFTGVKHGNCSFSTMMHNQNPKQCSPRSISEFQNDNLSVESRNDTGVVSNQHVGKNVSRKDKVKFLVNTLLDLKDSKEAVYGALDAWAAWELSFPIASLKRAVKVLEEQQQYHRIIQVLKWMLSKGQGNTMGTYCELIHALDMDHRAEEAHKFWVKKIGNDLHSVPWQLCKIMISMYHRNNMLERLVKLFKNLEAFERKPPDRSVVRKVADAYEILGLLDEKERVLEKYNSLFTQSWRERSKTKALQKKLEKSGKRTDPGTSDSQTITKADSPME